jgi:hypothetical protein
MTRQEQIEQKAKELGQKYFPDGYNVWARPNYEAQYVEFACKEIIEWADEHLSNPYKDVIEHMSRNRYRMWKQNLWHDAQGNALPEIDKEVIVLCNNGKVCYGHRPKEYWDGKNIATGEVTRHYPKRYDKGGWNIPDVKWWLNVELPNNEEQQQ